MNAADRRHLAPVLGLLAALLGVSLIVLWTGLGREPHWRGHAAAPRLPPLGATLPRPTVPPLGHFAAIWQHPLFSPDRRPEAIANPDANDSGNLQLTGVIMLPGLSMAILHDKATGKDYRVREGQAPKSGPALVQLDPRSAVVDAGGSHLQLQLVSGTSPAAGSAAPAGSAGQSGPSVVVAPQPSAGKQVRMQPSPNSAAARARALRARIEAERRRARQHDGH